MFISASSLYDVDTSISIATSLQDVQGGLLARYEGLCHLPVASNSDVRNHLGAVADNMETIALFTTIDADIDAIHRLRQRTISIGSQLPMVGYTLDQEIEVEPLRSILRQPATDNVIDRTLRLIK